jgi:hypothetical protein
MGDSMRKYAILVISILALVVFASGCTDSGTATNSSGVSLDKTFSKSGITFNYPSAWKNSKYKAIVSGESAVQQLGTLSNSQASVIVQKVDIASIGGGTIEQLKDYNKKYIPESSNAQVLSDTQSTVNGLTAYELIFSVTDPSTNEEQKHYYVFIGKDNVVGYYLDFASLESDFDQELPLFKDIEQTIKIS